MVNMSKKTLCVALVALAAGSAAADGGWYPDWWSNNAAVHGSGHADADAEDYAVAGTGTASVASAFADNIVQGSNSIAASGSLAEGWYGESYADGDSDAYASTNNYNGETYSGSKAESDAEYDYYYGADADSDAEFYASAHGEDIVGAMGAQITVAVAEDNKYDDWWGYGGVGGAIGGAKSKARQGLEDWYGPQMLEFLDYQLDSRTMDEFDLATDIVLAAGYEIPHLG